MGVGLKESSHILEIAEYALLTCELYRDIKGAILIPSTPFYLAFSFSLLMFLLLWREIIGKLNFSLFSVAWDNQYDGDQLVRESVCHGLFFCFRFVTLRVRCVQVTVIT